VFKRYQQFLGSLSSAGGGIKLKVTACSRLAKLVDLGVLIL
jgi:hypothetical protein